MPRPTEIADEWRARLAYETVWIGERDDLGASATGCVDLTIPERRYSDRLERQEDGSKLAAFHGAYHLATADGSRCTRVALRDDRHGEAPCDTCSSSTPMNHRWNRPQKKC